MPRVRLSVRAFLMTSSPSSSKKTPSLPLARCLAAGYRWVRARLTAPLLTGVAAGACALGVVACNPDLADDWADENSTTDTTDPDTTTTDTTTTDTTGPSSDSPSESDEPSGTSMPTTDPGSSSSQPGDAGATGTSSVLDDASSTSTSDSEPSNTQPDAAASPVIRSTEPDDGASNVEPDVVLILTFDRSVKAGVGDLTLIDRVSGDPVEVTPIDDERVVFDAETVHVDFNAPLARSGSYAILLDAGAVVDERGLPFPGFAQGDWSFTTAPAPALTLEGSDPTNGQAGVLVTTDLTLTFSSDVLRGTQGQLTLFAADTAEVVATLELNDTTHVTLDGLSVVFELTDNLKYATEYYVTLDADAVLSQAGAAFPGLQGDDAIAFTTEPPPALELEGSTPADGDVNVDPATSLVLDFDAPVSAGSGNVELHRKDDDALVESIAIAEATIASAVVTLSWDDALDNGTEYYVLIDAGLVVSELGASFEGISAADALVFTTAAAPPTPIDLLGTIPDDDTTDVAVNQILTLEFDTPVVLGSGTISIFESASDTLFESIPVTDARVSLADANVEINPDGVFEGSTEYYVLVSAGSFESEDGASFAGISSATDFSFVTEIAFGLLSHVPESADTGIDPGTHLVLTFNDDVAVGAGAVEVWDASDDSLIESIPTSSGRVALDGGTVTVDLDSILAGSAEFYVTVEAGAFEQAGSAAPFAGFSDPSDWTFTTSAVTPPGGVGTGLTLWLDADYAASLKLGTAVQLWADRSGLYHDVRQSTAAAQPARAANAIGTRTAVRFDGTDDSLSASDGLPFTAFEGFVIWRSTTAPSTSAQKAILVDGDTFELNHGDTGGVSNALSVCAGSDCTLGSSWFSARFSPTPIADTVYLWDFGFDALTTSLHARSQGSAPVFQPAPTVTPAAPATPFAVGGDPEHCADTDGCHFAGDVGEILLYSRTLTQSERLAVVAYLRAKWGFAAPSCDAGESLGTNGSCYFITSGTLPWADGRSACQARGAGWDLTTIRSQADNDYVASILSADAWIGASDAATPEDWRWVNDTLPFWSGSASGEAINGAFANWTDLEPSGMGSGSPEACARFRPNNGDTWNDVGCVNDTYISLCEGPGN